MSVEFGLQLPSFSSEDDRDAVGFYHRMVAALSPEFTTLWVSDHMQFGQTPILEAWTRLTYLAALFPHLKVGHLVLGQGYRNPALLAKMSATLQHLSDGRFVLGIGAGWHEEEYRAYGYGYPSRGARVGQLAEAIQIIRALWTDSPATFQGEHYTIEGAYCEPRPDPVPPILVGTNGRKALQVVARWADGWNWDAPLETYQPAYEELLRACSEVGRDPATLWLTASVEANFPDDPTTFVAAYPSGYEEEATRPLGPTPVDAVEQLRPLVELGVSHFMVYPHTLRTLERFSTEVTHQLVRLGP
jgi:alkanesulfonate monooxygenase SsuD/methylene tetrahydromethanopterin reductase-like flavin-dependent oxidoreductase (luciferase family)